MSAFHHPVFLFCQVPMSRPLLFVDGLNLGSHWTAVSTVTLSENSTPVLGDKVSH